MDLQLAKKLVECCNEIGVDAEVYENYSGRGMYGKTTSGITLYCSLGAFISALIVCADMVAEVDEDIRHNLVDMKTDSMGMGIIVY